jgi:hypothetical protein
VPGVGGASPPVRTIALAPEIHREAEIRTYPAAASGHVLKPKGPSRAHGESSSPRRADQKRLPIQVQRRPGVNAWGSREAIVASEPTTDTDVRVRN